MEWCRSGPGCAAVAFEQDEKRRRNLEFNATAFGVTVEIRGQGPDQFDGASTPDAIFIGGGLTHPNLLDACLDQLPKGGRLVANTVTTESESRVLQAYARLGGELRRFQHFHGEPLGAFTGWRPQHPVTQWAVTK